MTEIKRSIEIAAPRERVWECIQPQNWTKLFEFVNSVDGYEESDKARATVVAGDKNTAAIRYNIEVTELNEKSKIVYRRYGGPLAGEGVFHLRSLQNGTLLTRKSTYEDNLSQETTHLLSTGIEKDNLKVKQMAEAM